MATRRAPLVPKRGDVCLVRLDPTQGAEIAKTRPAVVIPNDLGNRFSDLTIVAPITSKSASALLSFESDCTGFAYHPKPKRDWVAERMGWRLFVAMP